MFRTVEQISKAEVGQAYTTRCLLPPNAPTAVVR